LTGRETVFGRLGFFAGAVFFFDAVLAAVRLGAGFFPDFFAMVLLYKKMLQMELCFFCQASLLLI